MKNSSESKQINIVMFGNSIINQGPWEKVLNRNDVVNWGIPGYTTGQLIWTIKDVLLKYNDTKIWFIEGGINDITLGVPVQRIFENQKVTIDSLQRNRIIPVMTSTILKCDDKHANIQVNKLNKKIKKYCQKNQIDYVDLNIFLASHGELIRELSTDCCHLKQETYILYGEAINRILLKYGF